jgi:hypothetical protein
MEGFAAGGFGGDWVGAGGEGRWVIWIRVILLGRRGGDGAEKATRLGAFWWGRLPLSSRGRQIPRFSPAQISRVFFFWLAQFRSFSAAIFPTSFCFFQYFTKFSCHFPISKDVSGCLGPNNRTQLKNYTQKF